LRFELDQEDSPKEQQGSVKKEPRHVEETESSARLYESKAKVEEERELQPQTEVLSRQARDACPSSC